MPRIRVLIMISLFALSVVNGVSAQGVKPLQSATAPVITVAASAERVRFTSPNSVVQMHLQVYDNAGQLVFDVNSKGNVLDWTLQDSGGARLNAGSYLSVVTVKSLSGKLSQRIGSVLVQEKQVELERVEATQMTSGQQQAVGPIEENGALTILKAGEPEAATVVAHDGTQGEVSRSRGALSFRLGDFFSGKDEEQMRLTEEGNLGIGTDNPQAKLDVVGVIRTSKGIEFDNGTNVTKLTTTATGSLQQTLADGTIVPNATGSGTQNKLAKWIDGAGTLGDSVVTEVSGNIGIGTPTPQAALHVIGNQFLKPVGATPTYEVLAGSDPTTTVMLTTDSSAFGWQIAPTNAPSDTIVQVLGQSFPAVPNRGELGIYLGADSNSAFKVIQRGGPELMRVNRNGNVGIGVTIPTAKLDVAGDAKVSSNLTVDTNTLFVDATNHRAGIGTPTPSAVLNVVGTQPPPVATTGNGTDAAPVLQVIGGNGGNSTNPTGQNHGGNGASVLIQAGNAGSADPAGHFFGTGGSITLQAGAGQDRGAGPSGGITLQAGTSFDSGFGGSITLQPGLAPSGPFGMGFPGSLRLAPSAGNVGIGTANPVDKLSVVGSADFTSNVGIGTTAPARKLQISGVGSDGAGQTDVHITGTGPTASGITLESTGSGGRTYSLLSTAVNAGGGGNGGGKLAVFDVTAGVYRMTLDSAGNVAIGTFDADRTLSVNGTASKVGGGSWDTFSDERLKTIKGRFTPGLKAVMQLQPLRYEYKPNNALGLRSSGEHIGFGAQAVQKIIPEAVSKNDKGYLLVNNDPILWTMLNAIKEEQQQLQQKQVRVEKLEARLAALETVVKKMSVKQRPRRQ